MKKQKILSRKIRDTITPFELAKLKKAPGLKIIDTSTPIMVLVEGDAEAFEAFLKAHDGWHADPVVKYSIPEVRPQPARRPSVHR